MVPMIPSRVIDVSIKPGAIQVEALSGSDVVVLPILQGLDPLVSLPPHRRVVLTHAQMLRAQ